MRRRSSTGPGPFRILRSVILPLSVPAITAVTLFHFFFSWNDFFLPLLYLAGKPDLQPLSLGIQQFNALYSRSRRSSRPSALMTMVVPVVGLPPRAAGVHARRRRHRRRQVGPPRRRQNGTEVPDIQTKEVSVALRPL